MNAFAKSNGHEQVQVRRIVTDDDLLICDCGSIVFMPVFHVGILRSGLVGEPPEQVPIQSWLCLSCKKLVQNVQTQGEAKAKAR